MRIPRDSTPEPSWVTIVVLWILVFAALAYLIFSSRTAQAQTLPATLVRACPAAPAATGFGACTNSVWAIPAAGLIVDVLRAGVTGDVWITPTQLLPSDRVFACQDASIVPGAFKNCPTTLAGQTNNYLAQASINFHLTPPPSTSLAGQLKLTWSAPTLDNTGSAITQPMSYQVWTRPTSCASVGPNCQPDYTQQAAPAAVVAAPQASVTLPAGPYCAVVYPYFTGNLGTIGPASDETCGTVVADVTTPGKVTNVHFN